MAFRLAVVCLALAFFACGGSGGGSSPSSPQPQWGRGRSDDANSGVSFTGVTNLGFPFVSTRLSQGPIRTTPAIGANGTVFVMTEEDGLFALDPDGVTILWQFPTLKRLPSLGRSSCSVAVDGFNNTFFGTDDGWIVGLDQFGVPLWDPVNLGSAIIGSPLLVIDPVLNLVQAFFVASRDGRIFGIGGQDGQKRWEYDVPGGPIEGSVIFDGVTLYASSADGFLYFLNQRGSVAFPKAPLGALGADFTASPNLFAQILAQSDLVGEVAPGRVRGITTNGLPIWDTDFDVPVSTSLAQFSRVLDQRVPLSNGGFAESQLTVTDFVAVDDNGSGWFLDPQLGSRGKRCIGGQNDLQPCRQSSDCPQAMVTPTPSFAPKCLPPYACVGGTNDGMSCREDTGTTDCPLPGTCRPITNCKGGSRDGQPCNEVDLLCPDGFCDLAIFRVDAPITAPPVTTVEGTIYVATAPEGVGGTLYAIEPPSNKVPLESQCGSPSGPPPPAFCRFAFTDVVGAIVAAPAIATAGTVYLVDDKGYLYTLAGSEVPPNTSTPTPRAATPTPTPQP